MNIPVFRPSVNTERALELLREVFESGWLGMGPAVAELERKLADRLSVKHFIATNSCTAALHLAVKTLDLPPGSEVLTSPITFVAGNAVLLYEDLRPLFAEVEPRSGNMNPNLKLDELRRCGAVIVTHLGGYPCNMDEINARAQRCGLPVIEDCAHAFGSTYYSKYEVPGKERVVGNTDNVCCWSFHAVKNLGIGDGGGISTNDDKLAERLRRLRWMGIDKSTAERTGNTYATEYDISELGYKHHMNDVAAAVALAQLETVDADNARRLSIVKRYARGLKRCGTPWYGPNELSSCHFWPVFVAGPWEVAEELAKRGISTTRHYRPNFLYRPFLRSNLTQESSAAAWSYYDQALVLPLFPSMTEQEVDYVIRNFNEVMEQR